MTSFGVLSTMFHPRPEIICRLLPWCQRFLSASLSAPRRRPGGQSSTIELPPPQPPRRSLSSIDFTSLVALHLPLAPQSCQPPLRKQYHSLVRGPPGDECPGRQSPRQLLNARSYH